MKKVMIVMMCVCLIAAIAYGYQRTSYEQTADAVVCGKVCKLTSVGVITDGTNDAKIVIYDNATEASGRVIWEMTVIGAGNFGGRYWEPALQVKNGIFVDVSGTGASYVVDVF